MPPRASAKPTRRDRLAGRNDVAFFLAMILFLVFSLGSVIVSQKVAIRYMVREFPRVAEHNYRTLQNNQQALGERLLRQMEVMQNACAQTRGGWLLPPSPEATSIQGSTPQ